MGLTLRNRPWNFTAPLSDMVELQEEMTNVLLPQLEAITPGSGCYLNEVFRPLSHRGSLTGYCV